MLNEDFYLEYQKRLRRQLREHRIKRKLSQSAVADAVGKALETYQRWETSGQHLTDIFSLLSVFQVLGFSVTEIIEVLGLPALTLNEIEAVYQDENILKRIKENGICSAMRQKCPDMADFTLEKLLVLILEERLKRLKSGD